MIMEGINWFDAIVVGLIILFGLRGLTNGIMKEIFGILGLIGGLWIAVRYKEMAGAWIASKVPALQNANGIFSGDTTQTLIGFLAVLFGVWIICLILGEIISKLFKWSGLGFVDRIGGFAFSVAKIFLIFAVIITFARGPMMLNEQTKKFFETSAVAPVLLSVGKWIMDLKDDPVVKENLQNLEQKASEILTPSEDNATEIQNNISNEVFDINQSLDLNVSEGRL